MKSIESNKEHIEMELLNTQDYLEQNGYFVQILHNDLFAIKLNLLEH